MRSIRYYTMVAFLSLFFAIGLYAQADTIDYLGQKTPGYYPEKFAVEIFNNSNEWGPVFSPDGNELFYTWQNPNGSQDYHINYMEKIDGVWSTPIPAPFTDINGSPEIEPNFTPDGKRLYFDSERQGGFGKADIWYVEKTDTGWSMPVNAGDTINTIYNDNFASFTEDGSMFFCSDRNNADWDIDIYYAKFENGKFLAPIRLADSINTPGWDACPTVVNDKLFFESSRSGNFGGGDIYFSQISGDSFGKAELMSANFNTNKSEMGLVLSPDKKYLFFKHLGEANIYWVDAEALNYYGVEQEPFNYITSWYAGDTSQMKKALHPKLVKRRVVSTSEVWNVSYDWMINAVNSCTGCIDSVKTGQKDIQVLDQTDDMASIKVVSNEYADYLHLAKFKNQWKIVNALWEYKTTEAKGTHAEAEQLVTDYINSWKTKDTAAMANILLPGFKGRMALSLTDVEDVDYTWMVNNMKNFEDSVINESTTTAIEVLDTSNNMASIKLSHDKYVEYLHLSYIGNKWYIANSLRNYKLITQTTGIKNPEENTGIMIYPNPAKDKINLSFGSMHYTTAFVIISDMSGKLISSDTFHNLSTASIDLASGPKGVYFINLNIDGVKMNKKICIE
jgi:hypothetical protein